MVHIIWTVWYCHLVCDPGFKKLNIQNLSWKRSLASAKKQSWTLSNFEQSGTDFLSWLQIQKSNTWRQKRNLINSMNYCNDQWYPTVKECIAVTILKLINIALCLLIQKSNTRNKMDLNVEEYEPYHMVIYWLKSISSCQLDGARFQHKSDKIPKGPLVKVHRIHWFIRTYSRSLSSDRFWRFERFCNTFAYNLSQEGSTDFKTILRS